VTLADSGRYTVEINGQSSNGAFTLNQHVQLQVAGTTSCFRTLRKKLQSVDENQKGKR
jgi:hypothetical protein